MGVINITPDSFSDGGKYFEPLKALDRSHEILSQGADVLDLGAQSTRPGAKEITPEEEINRLIPALRIIRKAHKNVLISVDTFSSIVASIAIEEGANWINDISGGIRDPEILKVVAEADCPYIVMHSLGNSENMHLMSNYNDVTKDVLTTLNERTNKALNSGIKADKIIWDPGLGFAKTTEQNLILLRDLEKIGSEGFPLLIGPSRKRFIGDTLKKTNLDDRIWGTIAVCCRCAEADVAVVRVHDVGPVVDALSMLNHIK